MTAQVETKTDIVYQTDDGTLTISMLDTVNLEFKTRLTCAQYGKKLPYAAFIPVAEQCVQTFLQTVVEEKAVEITRPSGGYVKDAFIQVMIPISMGKMSKTVEVQLDLSDGEGPELTQDQTIKVLENRVAELNKTSDALTRKVAELEEKIASRPVSVFDEDNVADFFIAIRETLELALQEMSILKKKEEFIAEAVSGLIGGMEEQEKLLEQVFIPASDALTIRADDLFAFLRLYYPRYRQISDEIPDSNFQKTQRKIMEMAGYEQALIDPCCEKTVWKMNSPFEYDWYIGGIPHHVIQTYRSLRYGIASNFATVSTDKTFYVSTGQRFVFLWGYPEKHLCMDLAVGDFIIGHMGRASGPEQRFVMDKSLIEEYDLIPATTLNKISEIQAFDDIDEEDDDVHCVRVKAFSKWW